MISRSRETLGGASGLTNLGRVVGRAKDQLGGAVVARADVRDVGLVLDEDLGAAEIAELQDAGTRVQQQILGLDVAVADALGVYVGEGAEELVDVELDFQDGHGGLHLVEIPRGAVDGLGDVLLHEIEVDLVLLPQPDQYPLARGGGRVGTHSLTIRVVECLELDDIWMSDDTHDLQLAVLGAGRSVRGATRRGKASSTHLESLVL